MPLSAVGDTSTGLPSRSESRRCCKKMSIDVSSDCAVEVSMSVEIGRNSPPLAAFVVGRVKLAAAPKGGAALGGPSAPWVASVLRFCSSGWEPPPVSPLPHASNRRLVLDNRLANWH
eukprot:558871-Prymnesium_polylepis.1